MECTELLSEETRKRLRREEPIAKTVVLHRFEELHEEGRRLIRGWAERAVRRANCEDRQCYEPFIFA